MKDAFKIRRVDKGGARAPPPHPEFVRSVNSIQTRGPDYAPHTNASPSGFKKLSTPLKMLVCNNGDLISEGVSLRHQSPKKDPYHSPEQGRKKV